MTRFCRTFAVIVVALAVATAGLTANAQRRGGGQRGGPGGPGMMSRGGGPGMGMMGRGGGANPVFLLMNSQVRDELKLTEDQMGKVREIMEASRGERPERRPGGEEMSEADREKMRAEFQKRFDEIAEKIKKEVLSAAQAKRLGEIMLWVQGPAALADAKVVKALGITPEQKEQIQAALEEYGEGMRGLREVDEEQRDAKRNELRQTVQGKIKGVLSEEQAATLKEMMGERFQMEFQRPQFQRGQRPQGPGGQRPQGPGGQGEAKVRRRPA